ncbi:hypothetical protein D3C86_1679420 [compost metagenome]
MATDDEINSKGADICTFTASDRVATVNERPSACTISSLPSRSVCKYGTQGNTKTAVSAVTNPVAAPIGRLSHLLVRERLGR